MVFSSRLSELRKREMKKPCLNFRVVGVKSMKLVFKMLILFLCSIVEYSFREINCLEPHPLFFLTKGFEGLNSQSIKKHLFLPARATSDNTIEALT